MRPLNVFALKKDWKKQSSSFIDQPFKLYLYEQLTGFFYDKTSDLLRSSDVFYAKCSSATTTCYYFPFSHWCFLTLLWHHLQDAFLRWWSNSDVYKKSSSLFQTFQCLFCMFTSWEIIKTNKQMISAFKMNSEVTDLI